MNTPAKTAFLLALAVLCTVPAAADTVHLKDGRVLQGDVTEHEGEYEIKQRFGTIRVPKADVLRIEAGPSEDQATTAPAQTTPEAIARDLASRSQACRQATLQLVTAVEELGSAELGPRLDGLNRPADRAADLASRLSTLSTGLRNTARRLRSLSQGPLDAAQTPAVEGHVQAIVGDMEAIELAANDLQGRFSRVSRSLNDLVRGGTLSPAQVNAVRTLVLHFMRTSSSLESTLSNLEGTQRALGSAIQQLGISAGRRVEILPEGTSVGTGFFIDQRHVLTNAHVVGSARQVEVQTDGPMRRGTVLHVGTADGLDLAVVETDRAEGAHLRLAPDQSKQPGSVVFAYGFGVLAGDTKTLLVTRGAVSALQLDQRRIVFDARVNPGNSGGPLVDPTGRWLGVVVAKSRASEAEAVESLSLAIDAGATCNWLRTRCSLTIAVDAAPVEPLSVPADAQMRSCTVRIVVRPSTTR